MDTRQILILLKIGNIDVSQKCIDDVSVDRNFSDVGDKFSITLIDTPDTSITYDLELYMASGYRSMTLKYGDLSTSKLVAYNGTIWDYTNTFVGNIRKLTITGIMNRYNANTTGVANSMYNIDWNSYYYKRQNESQPYGAMKALLRNRELTEAIKVNSDGKKITDLSSAILDSTYRTSLEFNSKWTNIKGPSGNSIRLLVPDCFFHTDILPSKITSETIQDIDKSNYEAFYNFINDPNDEYWGKLFMTESTSEAAIIDYVSIPLADKLLFSSKSTSPFYYKVPSNMSITSLSDDVLRKIGGVVLTLQNVMKSQYDSWAKIFMKKLNDQVVYLHWDILKTIKLPQLGNKTLPQYGVADFESFIGCLTTLKGFAGLFFDTNTLLSLPTLSTPIKQDSSGYTTDYVLTFNGDAKMTAAFKVGSKAGPFIMLPGALSTNYILNQLESTGILSNPAHFEDSLKKSLDDNTETYYFYSTDDYDLGPTAQNKFLRGFIMNNGNDGKATFYLQANPEKAAYGSACLVNSGNGVDISDIVKKLCILEGWKTKNGYITQTELVANSDSFIMQGQTAMDFIINNLVPRSITPIGVYTLTDGTTKFISTPKGGFYPFFDDEGYFHYQPITEDTVKDLNIPNLGYNIPNSPVLSFQINTKGTAFYTNNKIECNPISLITGTKFEDIEAASDAVTEAVGNAKYHNDTFDAWLGITFNDAESRVSNSSSYTDAYDILTSMAQIGLVTNTNSLVTNLSTDLAVSAETDVSSVVSRIANAKEAISKKTVQATMSMWGNFEMAPARNIVITNMLKGGVNNSNSPVKHPSSGKYMILSMQDRINSSGFIQNLNLLRVTSEVENAISKEKINYSIAASYKVAVLGSSDLVITENGTIEDALPMPEGKTNAER